MRAVFGMTAGEHAGGSEKAGVATHDHIDRLDAREREIVEIVAEHRAGDVAGGRAITRRVIVDTQFVVDGFGDVIGAELVAFLCGQVVDDAGGVGRVVAADVEEIADVVLLEAVENFLAIGRVRLVARREPRAAAGVCAMPLEQVIRDGFQADEFLLRRSQRTPCRAPSN